MRAVVSRSPASLRNLLLFDNCLSESLSDSLGDFSHRESLRVDGNHDLSGPIPPSLSRYINLSVLNLANTKISGSSATAPPSSTSFSTRAPSLAPSSLSSNEAVVTDLLSLPLLMVSLQVPQAQSFTTAPTTVVVAMAPPPEESEQGEGQQCQTGQPVHVILQQISSLFSSNLCNLLPQRRRPRRPRLVLLDPPDPGHHHFHLLVDHVLKRRPQREGPQVRRRRWIGEGGGHSIFFV